MDSDVVTEVAATVVTTEDKSKEGTLQRARQKEKERGKNYRSRI